jgi:CRT-like, chloroquine-resistance transporter-like
MLSSSTPVLCVTTTTAATSLLLLLSWRFSDKPLTAGTTALAATATTALSSAVGHMDHCESAPLFVTTYLLFNVTYNVILIVILKYGR